LRSKIQVRKKGLAEGEGKGNMAISLTVLVRGKVPLRSASQKVIVRLPASGR